MFHQSLMIDPDNSFLDFPFATDPVPDPEFPFAANNMDPYLSPAAVAAAVSTSAPAMQSPAPLSAPYGALGAYGLVPDVSTLSLPMGFEAPMTPYYSSSSLVMDPMSFSKPSQNQNNTSQNNQPNQNNQNQNIEDHQNLNTNGQNQNLQNHNQNQNLSQPSQSHSNLHQPLHQPMHQNPLLHHLLLPHLNKANHINQPIQHLHHQLPNHSSDFMEYPIYPGQLLFNSSASLTEIGDLKEPVFGSGVPRPAPLFPVKEEPKQPMLGTDYDPNAYFQKLLDAMQKSKTSIEPKKSSKKRYRVLRGVSAGGSSSKPPKENQYSSAEFVPVQLHLDGAELPDICFPMWGAGELEDGRRIVRIERTQEGPNLHAKFSIVGCANENPVPLPGGPDTDVIEVLCLQCEVMENNDEEDTNGSDDTQLPLLSLSIYSGYGGRYHTGYEYYITSVEVVGIVELLIGTQLAEPQERRKERGRIRSNLVPFWLKKPVSLRIQEGRNSGHTNNKDLRYELAKRIMSYDIRRPRGFDKEVRILRWDKLIPALKRALQSYYVELTGADKIDTESS